jgi:hypothetical protein
MPCFISWWPVVVVGGLAWLAADAGAPGDYLTKDGQLKEPVEVLELQGGFAGFTGTYWAIDTDGKWSTGTYGPKNKKGAARDEGKLTPEQLSSLARDLAKFDLAGLPNHGKSETNPRVLQIRFGKKSVTLQPRKDDTPAKDDEVIRARYQGIAQTVQALCKSAKKE